VCAFFVAAAVKAALVDACTLASSQCDVASVSAVSKRLAPGFLFFSGFSRQCTFLMDLPS
jgi:hypothetical protein